jgi:hypothetical protein
VEVRSPPGPNYIRRMMKIEALRYEESPVAGWNFATCTLCDMQRRIADLYGSEDPVFFSEQRGYVCTQCAYFALDGDLGVRLQARAAEIRRKALRDAEVPIHEAAKKANALEKRAIAEYRLPDREEVEELIEVATRGQDEMLEAVHRGPEWQLTDGPPPCRYPAQDDNGTVDLRAARARLRAAEAEIQEDDDLPPFGR